MYVYQITVLYTFNILQFICQLYLKKALLKKKKTHRIPGSTS